MQTVFFHKELTFTAGQLFYHKHITFHTRGKNLIGMVNLCFLRNVCIKGN